MRQRRYVCLYAPAVVIIVWAGVFRVFGRDDTTVMLGLITFAFALAFFARQIIRDLIDREKRVRRLERHP